MNIGLTQREQHILQTLFESFKELSEVILFGSRALGTHKPASDVDLVLKGDSITIHILAKLKYQIEEETTLPYFFDILIYDFIENKELKHHIDRHGKTIWKKQIISH